MLGWFRALMPKEERFFELFTRHAQVTLTGAEALWGLLHGGDDVLRFCKEISTRENEADEITREILTALRRSFITPLDRGDIKDLITSMDDAIDQMNKTAKVIALFELTHFEEPMQFLQFASAALYSLGHGCWAGGGSSTPWARGSPACIRSRASARRPVVPRRCSSPPISAFRCPPPIRSLVRSSGWGQPARCRRCAGISPVTW